MDCTAVGSVLDLCQNKRRRIVLGALTEEQRSVALNDLSKVVFKYTHHTPLTEAPADVLRDIRVSLYHAHLPKLATGGLINYDAEAELVEPTERLAQVQGTVSTILRADSSLEAPIEL